MAERHQKEGIPKITWDHPGNITDMDFTLSGDTRFAYSGHPSGRVYREFIGIRDHSNTLNEDGVIPIRIKTARYGQGSMDIGIDRAILRHRLGSEVTIKSTTGDYGGKTVQKRTAELELNVTPLTGTYFDISGAGDWIEYEIEHDLNEDINFLDIRAEIVERGRGS